MKIRNPVDFLGFIASIQLFGIRRKQHGKHKIKNVLNYSESMSNKKLFTWTWLNNVNGYVKSIILWVECE